jgi:hypothetical protein
MVSKLIHITETITTVMTINLNRREITIDMKQIIKTKPITIIEILTKITNSSTIISIETIAIILDTIERIKIENRIITTLDIKEAKD